MTEPGEVGYVGLVTRGIAFAMDAIIITGVALVVSVAEWRRAQRRAPPEDSSPDSGDDQAASSTDPSGWREGLTSGSAPR